MFSMVVENMDVETREKYLSDLYAPLPGSSPDTVSESVVKDEMQSFLAFDAEVR